MNEPATPDLVEVVLEEEGHGDGSAALNGRAVHREASPAQSEVVHHDDEIEFLPASPAGTERVRSPVAGDASGDAEASEDEDDVVLLANAASDDEDAVSYPVDAGVASFPPAQVS